MTGVSPTFLHTAAAAVAMRNRHALVGGGRGVPTPRVHPPKPPPHAWLTVAEVEAQLNVSRETVDRLLKFGELPASKVGPTPTPGRRDNRPWRILQANVDKYMKSQEYNPLAGTPYADEWGDP